MVVIMFAVVSVPFVYSTVRGYTEWWFWRKATVTIDGTFHGFVHTLRNNSAAIITRTDTSPRQSYLVSLSGRGSLIHCGEWSAPRFPVFPIGDVNPPCLFSDGVGNPKADYGVPASLSVQSHAVEFTTVSGRKIKASW